MQIGRQVSHFAQVDLTSMEANFSVEPIPKYRYTLSMQYKQGQTDEKRTKKAVIILKNPSSADIFAADKTIATAETAIWIHFQDVLQLTVLNLFAIRGTYPNEVADRLKTHGYDDILGPDNDSHFGKVLATTDYIIAAWGGNSGIQPASYDRRIDEVQNMIVGTGKPTYRKLPKGSERYPFHACMWGYKDPFVSIAGANAK